MSGKSVFAVLGVSMIAIALCAARDEQGDVIETPMGPREPGDGKRGLETPEVVLQLKYDGGELDRIYLAQYRQGAKWAPSVPARSDLCADLCHAGLGGIACGNTCHQMIPVGLHSALANGNVTDAMYGEPRVHVCPTLCENFLGEPLCSCPEKEEESEIRRNVDWAAICSTFCEADGYVLSGCPECGSRGTQSQLGAMRSLNTAEGWSSWCNVQCHQGHGGAACNCDRAPFQ